MENLKDTQPKNEGMAKSKAEIKAEAKAEETNGIFNLLDIQEEDTQEEFLNHTIITKVTHFGNFSKNAEGKIVKVQIQNKAIDEESKELIDFTFTLSAEPGIIKENNLKDLVGKYIKVINVNRYVKTHKDAKEREIGRDMTYGAEYIDMVVMPNTKVEHFEVNTFVEIELTSVSDVIKKDKPTGDVKLISIKADSDGSAKTFECKFKHDDLGIKLNKDMFKPILGKKIRVNFLNDARMNGKTYYSTKTMPEQVQVQV